MNTYPREPFLLALLIAGAAILPGRAESQVLVAGSLVQEAELPPGSEHSGTIRVRNPTPEPQEFRVYGSDYSFQASESRFEEPGSLPRSNAGWISFRPSQAMVEPGGEVVIRYTVAVPEAPDRPLDGSYWSVLMIEATRQREPAEVEPGEVAIRPRLRSAVQIATHIEGSGAHGVDLRRAGVTTSPTGDATFGVDIVNTGERAYRPEVELHLFAEDGEAAGTFREERGLLYPGTSLRQSFPVDEVPPGSYEALITIDTGGPELFGAQLRVVF